MRYTYSTVDLKNEPCDLGAVVLSHFHLLVSFCDEICQEGTLRVRNGGRMEKTGNFVKSKKKKTFRARTDSSCEMFLFSSGCGPPKRD